MMPFAKARDAQPPHEAGLAQDGPEQDRLASRLSAVEAGTADLPEQPLGRAPYVSLRAFCETPAFGAIVDQAAADRRLSRAEMTQGAGGLRGATQFFTEQATPDLLIVETALQGNALFAALDELAKVCDAKTKVVLVGAVNDVSFYRRLVERGIDEYLVAPVGVLDLINVVLRSFSQDATARLGKVVAFIGAKGGTGSSTIAQNTAWSLAKCGTKVLLADLDLQFGTTALNFDIDAAVGFTEQLAGSVRLDDALFERLLHKHGPNLSILGGATASRDVVPPALEVLDRVLDRARATFPVVVLDLPHEWTPWVRQALLSADEVIVTAEPDLANLRNTRTMLDLLKTVRPNDTEPRLVLNRLGVARREEIKADDFAAKLETALAARFRFAPKAFTRAANAGQMIAEASGSCGKPFIELAQLLSGRTAKTGSRRYLRWGRRD